MQKSEVKFHFEKRQCERQTGIIDSFEAAPSIAISDSGYICE